VVPSGLKDLIPGSILFFFLTALPGVLLLFRKRDGGRAGRIWVTVLVASYLILSTPIAAVGFVELMSPDFPPVMSKADAHGATGIVLLSAGMNLHKSRGSAYAAPTREGSLRVLEAARVHRVLGGVPIIVTGGHGPSRQSEAAVMAQQLEQLGVPADHIIKEEMSTNTRDHAMFVPPLLKERGIGHFVLVTSRQHMARAVQSFRAVGANPTPSTPEVYVPSGGALSMVLPSTDALLTSESMIYDLLGWVYYKARGWV
jgi:uncharacterized SAM-binding protein YcdF (DUF218 family)